MAVNILVFLIIIPLVFGLPILIGVYVYRDATKRGMNAALWTLIAMCAPSLIGLIIYLLVRNNYSELTCPNCNTRVEEAYVICPNCRTQLRPSCAVCGTLLQTGWKVCPRCGTDVPEYDCNIATPVKHKDNTLGKILIAILVIPIVLIILLFLLAIPLSFNNVSRQSGYSTSSVTTLTVSEFLEDCTEKEAVLYQEYFNEFASSDEQPYHILIYDANRTDNIYEYQYLIYIPGAGEMQDLSYHTTNKGLFKKQECLVFDIVCDPAGDEQVLFIYNYEGNTAEPAELFQINYNGEEHEIHPDGHVGEPFLPMKSHYQSAMAY